MKNTTRVAWLWAATLFMSAASAQDEGLSVSVGARAWYAEWSTFSYFSDAAGNNLALTQVSAQNKLVLVPLVSARYGRYFGSLSYLPPTRFSFVGGDSNQRSELDLIAGYSVVPGLNLTLGYKKLSQRGSFYRYEPAGPVLGLNGSAPLTQGLAIYGAVAVGRLKTPQSGGPEVVKFDAGYRLTEVGLSYALTGEQAVPRWTLSVGYRIQVLSSREAFGNQDGRDTTQGFAFGAIASF